MSGGAIFVRPIHFQDNGELFGLVPELHECRDLLLEQGHIDAAASVDALISTMQETEQLMTMSRASLNDVLNTCDRWKSGDDGDDDLADAVQKWRERKGDTKKRKVD